MEQHFDKETDDALPANDVQDSLPRCDEPLDNLGDVLFKRESSILGQSEISDGGVPGEACVSNIDMVVGTRALSGKPPGDALILVHT